MEIRQCLILHFLLLVILVSKSDGSGDNWLSKTKTLLAKHYFTEEGKREVHLDNGTPQHAERMGRCDCGNVFQFSENPVVFVHRDLMSIKINPLAVQPSISVPLPSDTCISEAYEWKGYLFFVTCFKESYCNVFTFAHDMDLKLRHSFDVSCLPNSLHMFSHNGKLFLVITAETSTIYRWAGTYFDEVECLQTPNALSAEAIRFHDETMIVFAEKNSGSNAVVDVYKMKNGKTSLAQLLTANDVIDVTSFELETEEDGPQKFVTLLSAGKANQLFWWNGQEFSLWAEFDNLETPRKAIASMIKDEMFLFVMARKNVYIYHVTLSRLNLLKTISAGGDIRDLHVSDNNLILLTSVTPYFHKVSTTPLDVVQYPVHDNLAHSTLDDCLENYRRHLQEREKSLQDLSRKVTSAVSVTEEETIEILNNKKNTVLNAVTIKNLKVHSNGNKLISTPVKIAKYLKELQDRFLKLKSTFRQKKSNKAFVVKGDLYVKHLVADKVDVAELNRMKLNMDEFLSSKKNQSFYEHVKLKHLKTNMLDVGNINGELPDDILHRDAAQQLVKKELTIGKIEANSVKFEEKSRINGLKFDDFAVGNDRNMIKGRKSVTGLNVKDLNADIINNEISDDWIADILPTVPHDSETENALNVTNLKVTNLEVDTINDMPWETFVELLEQPASLNGDVNITNLKTKRINGIDVDSLFRLSGSQNILSDITVPFVASNHIRFSTVNNATLDEISRFIHSIDTKTLFSQLKERTTTINVSDVVFEKPVEIQGITIDFNRLESQFNMENTDLGLDFDLPEGNDELIESNSTSKSADEMGEEVLKSRSGFLNLGTNRAVKVYVYGDIMIENRLHAGYLNGINASEFLQNIITLDSEEVINNVTFASLNAQLVETERINGHRVPDQTWSVKINGSLSLPSIEKLENSEAKGSCNWLCDEIVTIRGERHVKQPIHVKTSVEGNINELDMGEFSKRLLSKSKDQNITSTYWIDNVFASNIKADFIDGVSSQLIMSRKDEDGTRIINSDIKLGSLGVRGNINATNMDCDMNKLSAIDLSKLNDFESVEIAGDLTWEEGRHHHRRSLSYILDKTVRKNGEAHITGSVVFENNVTFNSLKSKQFINDIDIGVIAEDAILTSEKEQTMFAQTSFVGPITARDVTGLGNLVVYAIDDVEIMHLNESLVRRNSGQNIHGKKIFTRGFLSETLDADELQNVRPDNIVIFQDFPESKDAENTRLMPDVTFNHLHVTRNLITEYVNDVKLRRLLKHRLTLKSDQIIEHPFTFSGNLSVLGDLKTSAINDIDINSTLLIDGTLIFIDGDIEFEKSLEVFGDIGIESYNGTNLKKAYERFIKIGTNTTINANVIFEDDLIVNGTTETDVINGCHIHSAVQKVKNYRPEYTVGSNQLATRIELDAIKNITKRMRHNQILKYLEKNNSIDVDLEIVKSTSIVNNEQNDKTLNLYGLTSENCILPEGCFCPKQYSIDLKKLSSGSKFNYSLNERYYRFFDSELLTTVDVRTNSVSYSPRCKLSNADQEEFTTISWNTTSGGNDSISIQDGYLSEVKFFKLGDSIYVVLAFSYNKSISEPYKVNLTVFELRVSLNSMKEVDSIPAKGAIFLDIVWTPSGYILVVSNSYSEDPARDTVSTHVYIFNERANKFNLLRKLKTHGMLNLRTLRMKKESFIIIVQKQPWPLTVFRFHSEHSNMLFTEKIYDKVGFMNVGVIPMEGGDSDDAYVSVFLSNDKFGIYKYKFIEGFVEELSIHQEAAQASQSFAIDGEQYILVVSSKKPSYVYRIIKY